MLSPKENEHFSEVQLKALESVVQNIMEKLLKEQWDAIGLEVSGTPSTSGTASMLGKPVRKCDVGSRMP